MKERSSSFPFHSLGSISYFYSTSHFHVYIMMNALGREFHSIHSHLSSLFLLLHFSLSHIVLSSFAIFRSQFLFKILFAEMSVLDLLYSHNDCVRHVMVLSRTDLLLELSYHVRLITFLSSYSFSFSLPTLPLSLSLFFPLSEDFVFPSFTSYHNHFFLPPVTKCVHVDFFILSSSFFLSFFLSLSVFLFFQR